MGIAYLIIGGILMLGGIGLLIYLLRSFIKDRRHSAFDKKLFVRLLGSIGLLALGGGILQGGINVVSHWADAMNGGEATMSIIGAVFFDAFFALLWSSFALRFYKPDMDAKQLKWVKICLYGSIPLALIFFLLLTEGVADHLDYPLPNGFYINGTGIGWTYWDVASSGLVIHWYGVCILAGFLTAYAISDHKFYQEFHKHGILETCLIVTFIFGILGARIWYVVGNWNGDLTGGRTFAQRVANGEWWCIFAVWEGGLTILGGAIGGILAGAIYVKLHRKYVPLTFALDTIVPTILVAQAIGRWGNFFNHEVYGQEVYLANGWGWLPKFISNMMGYTLTDGKIYVPLFLVEGIVNLIGFFVIAYLIPFLWKKYRAKGVLSGFYLIWYGVVRIILEPLRDPHYNMGTNGNWSIVNSAIYIGLGVAVIAFFEIYEFVILPKLGKKKELANEKVEEPAMKVEEVKAEESKDAK